MLLAFAQNKSQRASKRYRKGLEKLLRAIENLRKFFLRLENLLRLKMCWWTLGDFPLMWKLERKTLGILSLIRSRRFSFVGWNFVEKKSENSLSMLRHLLIDGNFKVSEIVFLKFSKKPFFKNGWKKNSPQTSKENIQFPPIDFRENDFWISWNFL